MYESDLGSEQVLNNWGKLMSACVCELGIKKIRDYIGEGYEWE